MIVARPFYVLEASLCDPGCLWLASLCLQYEKASAGLDNLEVHTAVSFSDSTIQRVPRSSIVSSNHAQTWWSSGSAALVPFPFVPSSQLSILVYWRRTSSQYSLISLPSDFHWFSANETPWERTEVSAFCLNPSLLKNCAFASGSTVSFCHHNSCQEAQCITDVLNFYPPSP